MNLSVYKTILFIYLKQLGRYYREPTLINNCVITFYFVFLLTFQRMSWGKGVGHISIGNPPQGYQQCSKYIDLKKKSYNQVYIESLFGFILKSKDIYESSFNN